MKTENLQTKKSLFDKLVDKALDASTKISDIRTEISELAVSVNTLARSIVGIAHAVQAHHMAISELYAIQSKIMSALNDKSVDSKFSELKKKDGHDKPN